MCNMCDSAEYKLENLTVADLFPETTSLSVDLLRKKLDELHDAESLLTDYRNEVNDLSNTVDEYKEALKEIRDTIDGVL